MLRLVRDFWIRGVFEQSLHNAVLIDLGIEERADFVEHPWDLVLQRPDQPSLVLPAGTRITDVFYNMGCSLLILGTPGSGKTTMLLELARDTIVRAEEDSTLPIPVVLNLSSWIDKDQSISKWIENELNTKYNVPRRIAQSWVENEELLMLLDGLDEVKLKLRNECVKAINDFRQEHGATQLVVCSRVADYEMLNSRLRVQGAALLLPLSFDQVDRYLEKLGPQLQALRRTIQENEAFQELGQSPLMLSIMILAYKGISFGEIQSSTVNGSLENHLFGLYVQRMFERRSTRYSYSREHTISWLTNLARIMSKRSETVFLVERMQPDWLQTKRWQYDICLGLVFSPIFGLIGKLLGSWGGPTLETLGTVIGALVGALIFGPFYNFTFGKGITEEDILPIETIGWSWVAAWDALRKGFRQSWKEGLVLGLMVGFLTAINKGWLEGLGTFALFFLTYPFLSLFFDIHKGIRYEELRVRVTPNQGIYQSLKNSIIVGSIAAFVISIPAWLATRSKEAVLFGLLVGFLLWVLYGGLAIVQHSTLRVLLFINGRIPLDWERFLDYASERVFLRKVGGGFIFIHRLLLEYFATKSS